MPNLPIIGGAGSEFFANSATQTDSRKWGKEVHSPDGRVVGWCHVYAWTGGFDFDGEAWQVHGFL
jgi:hypothetical protein